MTLRPGVRTWATVLAAWTVVALVFSAQWIAMAAVYGEPFRWRTVFYNFSDSYTWALVTPLVLELARRFPLDRARWRRGVAVHLPASALVTLLQLGLVAAVDRLLADPGEGAPATLGGTFLLYAARRFAFGLVTYWVIVGIAVARDYYRLYRDREVRASRLEARLARTQLQVLKMQLQPHFLFNTLHAISALVHEDAEQADRMVAHLSELLRLSLENAGAQEVTLRRELEFLEAYLQIERARFGSRLVVGRSIDPALLDARVPNLVLQPLVESAVRHGVARRAGRTCIEIAAGRRGDRLRLEVLDAGEPPLPGDGANGRPRGAARDGSGRSAPTAAAVREDATLGHTRARLQQLYGAAHRLELLPLEGGGLRVTLEIPFGEGNATDGGDDHGGAEDPGAHRR